MAITQVNLPAVYGAVQQHKQGQMQNQLLQMQMDAQKQATQKQGQLSALFAKKYGGLDTSTGIDWNTGRQGPAAMTDEQFTGQLMALDPQAGMAFQDHITKMTKAQREQWLYEAPLVARAMSGVKDQQSYAAALNSLGNAHVDIADLPEQFSPEAVQSMMALGQEAESFTLSPGQTRFGPGGQQIASLPATPAGPKSDVGKLIADMNALPPNSPLRKHYEAAIAAETQGGGPFSGTSMDAQTMNTLLQGDPASPEYLAAYNHYSQPRVSFDPQTGRQIVVRPDMSAFRRPAGLQPAPAASPVSPTPPAQGDRAGVDVENVAPPRLSLPEAQAVASLQGAGQELDNVEGLFFPNGKYDKGVATAAGEYGPMDGIPFTQGRTARQSMRRAIEVILRTRTGAAAPDSEVDSYMNQYFPSAADTAEQARAKLDAAKAFMDDTYSLFGASRNMPGATPKAAPKQPEASKPTPPPGFVLVE